MTNPFVYLFIEPVEDRISAEFYGFKFSSALFPCEKLWRSPTRQTIPTHFSHTPTIVIDTLA